MKITKRQLRRIIQEQGIGHETAGTGIDRGNRFTPDVIAQYLSDNAATYHQDPVLDAGSIAMLLRDDFMDNIGAQVTLSPEYEDLIVNLSHDPGYVAEGKTAKVTERQLRRIIKEEKRKILSEGLSQEENLNNAITEYVNDLADQRGVDPLELKADVLDFVEGWFEYESTAEYEEQVRAADDEAREEEYAAGRPWEHN